MPQKKTDPKKTIRCTICDYTVLKRRQKKNGKWREINSSWCVMQNHWLDKHESQYEKVMDYSNITYENLVDSFGRNHY